MPSLCSASATKPERSARVSSFAASISQRGSISPATAVVMAARGLSARSRSRRRSTAARLGQIGLRDHQPVGEDRLLARFRRPAERVEAADGADHRQHHLDEEFPAQRPIGRERLQDRPRIGEPAGLDHDPPERRHRAARALGHQAAQRHLQVGAGIAAEAAVAEQRDLVGAVADERVVDADGAVLVDHDRGVAALRRRQEAAHQRGLAGAEKAGDDRDRDARPARALEPSPERAGLARGEQIEQLRTPSRGCRARRRGGRPCRRSRARRRTRR